MIGRFAGAYVRILLVLAIFLFTSSLLLNVSVLMGTREFFAGYGQRLFLVTIIAAIPITPFEKERNIWKNEFRSCPGWMRKAIVIFMLYGLFVTCLQLIAPDGIPLYKEALTTSAIPLSFDAIFICILYSVIWSGSIDESALVKRTRNSVLFAAVCMVGFLANRAGYFPHPQVDTYSQDGAGR